MSKQIYLQVQQPTPTCSKDLKELGINESLSEIKQITKMQYNKLLKLKIKGNAFKYLNAKKGKKGTEIVYSSISMADYLQTYNKMSISQKQSIFAIRNKTNELPEIFSSIIVKPFVCVEEEN